MKRILIVDDEEDIRALYQSELEAEGFRTDAVSSGEEALQFIEENSDLSLVVLDIKMAHMDGLEVLENLRSKKANMPIILNSAYATYKSNFNSWLADAYIVKSANLDELKNQVKELLAV